MRFSAQWLWRSLSYGTQRHVVCRKGTCSAWCLLHTDFLFGLILNPEEGGNMVLRNTGRLSPEYMAVYPRRQNSLFWLRFPWFSSIHPSTFRDITLKLDHEMLLPHPFRFITYCHPIIRYSGTDNFAKWTKNK